ncbi:hypothetical protein DICPUDRAFT_29091, partial [Dictyostelium purpureum]
YGVWNATLGMFQIEFVIKKNSVPTGRIQYQILNDQTMYVSSDFLPESAQLIVKKSNFDGVGPVFTKIEKLSLVDKHSFGWLLYISDPINGFESGEITVMGSMDNSIYNFYLNTTNLIGGDIYEGIWQIRMDLDPRTCVNQNYTITYVRLLDSIGQKSIF